MIEKTTIILLLISLLFLFPTSVRAETEGYGDLSLEELFNLDLKELFDAETEVASLFKEEELVVGSTVSSISPQQWKLQGARMFYDALNNQVSFMLYPTTCCVYAIAIRGYANSQSLVGIANMLDGVPVNNLTTGSTFYQTPNWGLGTLNKIELIKGPGSAIYGSDAFHGVLSLKTFESEKDHYSVEAAGAYPLYEEVTVKLSRGYANNVVRIDAAASASHQGDQDLEYTTDTDETGVRKNTYDSTTGVFKIKINPSTKLEIKSGLYFSCFKGEDFPGTGEGTTPLELGGNDLSDNNSRFLMGTLSIDYTLARDISLKASMFSWEGMSDYILGIDSTGRESYNHSLNRRIGYDLIIKQPDNPLNLQWLIAYSFNRLKSLNESMIIKNSDGSTFIDFGKMGSSGKSRDVNSGFFQLKWGAIKDSLYLLAGGRYDQYSYFGTQTAPRGGILFLPTKTSSIKAIYGKAFRAPCGLEQYGVGNLIQGNPDMKPETMDIYELIYIYQGKKWKLNVNGYYSYWKNAIIGKQNPSRWTNEGKSMAYGTEMRLFYMFTNCALDCGFSYVESFAIDVASVSDPAVIEDRSYNTFPQYTFIAGLYYTLKPLDIKFYLNNRVYLGMKEAPDVTRPDPDDLPAYYRADLNICKAIAEKMEVYCDVRNIFNRKNHVPSLVGNRDGYIEPGISVMLRASYTF
ncbi:MAG: TonB-dependent receptor plug domain-containing protein [bacterium]